MKYKNEIKCYVWCWVFRHKITMINTMMGQPWIYIKPVVNNCIAPLSPSVDFCIHICTITIVAALTHWGRVTHICVGKSTIIGSDNGLSPGRRQAIIWTNAGILLIEPLGTNFSEILIGIQIFSFKKMCLKCRLRNGVHFVSASMC